MGNFNSICCQLDKSGGISFCSSSTGGLLSFVNEVGLIDLGFSGNPFTWNNRRSGVDNIQECLD